MSSLCGCLGKQELTPLDAPFELGANCSLSDSTDKSRPDQRVLAFHRGKKPNFDFIAKDNGDHYIASYRAVMGRDVIGYDSKPIPKTVFDNICVIKKRKSGMAYCVDLDTKGIDLIPYFRQLTKEDLEKLGMVDF